MEPWKAVTLYNWNAEAKLDALLNSIESNSKVYVVTICRALYAKNNAMAGEQLVLLCGKMAAGFLITQQIQMSGLLSYKLTPFIIIYLYRFPVETLHKYSQGRNRRKQTIRGGNLLLPRTHFRLGCAQAAQLFMRNVNRSGGRIVKRVPLTTLAALDHTFPQPGTPPCTADRND